MVKTVLYSKILSESYHIPKSHYDPIYKRFFVYRINKDNILHVISIILVIIIVI